MKISEFPKLKGGERMCVGEKIKEYLQSAGISQAWLSVQTKIPPTKLNLALNGKRRMTFEEYACICWVLHVSADRFITPKAPDGVFG